MIMIREVTNYLAYIYKIRNINTVGVTFINVSAIGFAMCSLVCLEAKKKKIIPVAAV